MHHTYVHIDIQHPIHASRMHSPRLLCRFGDVRGLGKCKPCAALRSTHPPSCISCACTMCLVALWCAVTQCGHLNARCPAGRFSTSRRQSSCSDCAPGGFCSQPGADSTMVYEPCPEGARQSSHDVCASCASVNAHVLQRHVHMLCWRGMRTCVCVPMCVNLHHDGKFAAMHVNSRLPSKE